MQSFLTLLWKEFRQQRSLAVGMVAVTLFMQFIVFAAAVIDARPLADVAWMTFVFWGVISYAWGASATLFSRELEEGTADFLRRLPISSRLLLAAKLTWLVGSTLAVGVVLALIAALWILGTGGDSSSGELVGVLGVAIVEATAWGLFFSVRTTSQVRSLLWSGLIAGSVAYFVTILTGTSSNSMMDSYASAALPRLAVACIVLMISVWNARRWLVTSSRVAVETRTAGKLTPRAEQRLAATPPRGEMRWLVWHAFRQSRTIFRIVALVLTVAVFAVVAAVIYMLRRNELSEEMLFPLALLLVAGEFVAIVFSASTFWRDNATGAAAMLTHHGVAPGKLWWSRIIAFGGFHVAFVVPLLMIVTLILTAHNNIGIYTTLLCNESPTCLLVSLLSIFFVGQWISLTTRSIITAIMLTAASFCGMFVACVAVKILLGVTALLWTLVPMSVSCLLASRLLVSDWQRGRASYATWWKTRSPIILTAAAIFVAIPFVRVYSIPYVYLGYDLPDQTWESHYVCSIRDTRNSVIFSDLLRDNPKLQKWWEDARSRHLGIGENIRRFHEACNWSPPPEMWQRSHRSWLILQLCAMTPRMAVDAYTFGGLGIKHWLSGGSEIASDTLREVIDFLEAMPAYRAPFASHIAMAYQVERERITRGINYNGDLQPSWYRWLMPWERYRVLRLLDCEFQRQSHAATVWEKAIAEDKVPDATWNKWRECEWGADDLRASVILQDDRHSSFLTRQYCSAYHMLESERKRRMMLIVAALNLWYREHKSLPDDLQSLVGVHLKELPTEPLTKLPYKIFPPDPNSKDDGLLVPSVAAERKADKKFPSLGASHPTDDNYSSHNRITLRFVEAAE